MHGYDSITTTHKYRKYWVKWLKCLTAKQVMWVQSNFFCKLFFVQFIQLDENYKKNLE